MSFLLHCNMPVFCVLHVTLLTAADPIRIAKMIEYSAP